MTELNDKPKRFSKYYGSFAVILLNTLVLFLLLNLVADGVIDLREYLRKRSVGRSSQTFGFSGYDKRLKKLYPGYTEAQIDKLTQESRRVQLEYEAFTQFKEKPCKGDFVNVDSRGFRPVKDQGPWPLDNKHFTIFVFGGSTCFGYRASDDQTIPSHLQKIISENTQLPVKVYNFGRLYYFSFQERILLEKLIASGNVPNMVIFIDGLNDFAHWHRYPAFTRQLMEFMQEGSHTRAIKLLAELPIIKVVLPLLPKAWTASKEIYPPDNRDKSTAPEEQVLKNVVMRYVANKKLSEAIATKFNIKAVFVWQPVPVYHYDQKYNIFAGYNYGGLTPYLKAGYEFMAKYTKEEPQAKNFIWCADIQQDMKEAVYADAYHYSGPMNKTIALHIFKAMVDRNLLSTTWSQ